MNRRISRRASPRCAVVAWRAVQCGKLGNGGKRNLNWVAPASQLSKAAPSAAAPPSAHTSMSAIPSSFSQRCSYVCAGVSSMAQFFYMAAPRWLYGGLRVFAAHETEIAGGGAAR